MNKKAISSWQLAVGCLGFIFLVGCSSKEDRQNDFLNFFKGAKQTASGTVKDVQGGVEDALQIGKDISKGVQMMIDDTTNRINQVQSGVDKLIEAKDLIESGVTGE